MDAQPAIILFDGLCNLCNGVVRVVIKRDRHARFRFASLQSDAARRLCADAGYRLSAKPAPDTIVVLINGRALERSDAVLAVAARLPFPWPLLGVFSVLPRTVRDGAYRVVARNRYRWFGSRGACMIPSADIGARFID